ncbi:pilus assembly protein TadG-related protein [Photobacterium leiognathi]|uniref:pilus assembly protein TadG-related protein n=1 Tax=Photobacterium leiognathi TaxID=553611 RepID=UPI0029816CFA|nr:pilus assembly protein TadG-related protein [Photobacterium leiognathi]
MKKQQGVAAIILVLILIPLFGCVFFALEGTRYIQKKTRLADASEAAAIAVTEQNPNQLDVNMLSDPKITKITDSVLAKNYINSYVRNIKNEDISIQPSVTENYYQYKVNVNTEHQSWFNSTLIPSFKKTQSISESALARNDSALSNPRDIDLVLVADFSGSMRHNGKLETLKDAVNEISEKILANKSNRIAFVPFDMRTQELKANKHLCVSSLVYKDPREKNVEFSENYSPILLDEWVFKSEEEIRNIFNPELNDHTDSSGDGYCYLYNDSKKITDIYGSYLKYKRRKLHICDEDYYYINNKKNDGNYIIKFKDESYINKEYIIKYTRMQKEANTVLDIINESHLELNETRYKNIKNIILDDSDVFKEDKNDTFLTKKVKNKANELYKKINGNIDKLYNSLSKVEIFDYKLIDLFFNFYNSYPDPFEYIDTNKTAKSIFLDDNSSHFTKENNKLFDKLLCKNNFYTLKLKHYSHSEFMDSINSMEYGGFTSIYQGILRGSQILKGEYGNKKNNRLKIMILLSDGDDAPFEKTFKTLAEKGLCKNIEDYFKPNFHMGAIGIQYNAKKHSEILDCFGEENVYQADNKALLINKINSIIQKGQKSSGITKLSDGQN